MRIRQRCHTIAQLGRPCPVGPDEHAGSAHGFAGIQRWRQWRPDLARFDRRLGVVVAGAGLVVYGAIWRPVRRLEVVGHSMSPTLEPGDRVLYLRTRRISERDLVVVADPRTIDGFRAVRHIGTSSGQLGPQRLLVKRVRRISGDSVVVLGDNPPASTDSRSFGPLPITSVQGKVIYRYSPHHRAGAL